MDLKEFFRYRTKYWDRAEARRDERRSINDDAPFWQCVNEEMLIDIVDRLEKLEKYFEPQPEHEKE